MHACELLLAVLILAASRSAAAATDFPFALNTSGEAVADIMASSPGSSWRKTGAEAAVATIELEMPVVHQNFAKSLELFTSQRVSALDRSSERVARSRIGSSNPDLE